MGAPQTIISSQAITSSIQAYLWVIEWTLNIKNNPFGLFIVKAMILCVFLYKSSKHQNSLSGSNLKPAKSIRLFLEQGVIPDTKRIEFFLHSFIAFRFNFY